MTFAVPSVLLFSRVSQCGLMSHDRCLLISCRMRALDLMTGRDKFSSPSLPLAATQSFGKQGTVTFDAAQHWQRPGLALYQGMLYAAFASHCDASEFHPWIFGIDAVSMQARPHITCHSTSSWGVLQRSTQLFGLRFPYCHGASTYSARHFLLDSNELAQKE